MPATAPIAHKPFSYQTTKSGLVQIHFENRIITTRKDQAAECFLCKVEAANAADQQQFMARTTGQFKFGNER